MIFGVVFGLLFFVFVRVFHKEPPVITPMPKPAPLFPTDPPDSNKTYLSIQEYWNVSEASNIKFLSHANSIRDIHNCNDTHMLEIDVANTVSWKEPIHLLMHDSYSEFSGVKPKFDFWLKKFRQESKKRKMPALKLNLFAPPRVFFPQFHRHRVQDLGVPLWFSVQGVPVHGDLTNTLFHIYLSHLKNLTFVPTVCFSWHTVVSPWDKMEYNSFNMAYYLMMRNAILLSRMQHIIVSVRAELLRNSWPSFKKSMMENVTELFNNTSLKTLEYYIHGKTDEKFRKELLEASKNYSIFLNLEVVPFDKIYPGNPLNRHTIDFSKEELAANPRLNVLPNFSFKPNKSFDNLFFKILIYFGLFFITFAVALFSVAISSDEARVL